MKTSSLLLFLSLAVGCATLPTVDRDLFAAGKADDAGEVARLVAAGANVNSRTRAGGTPLHEAMEPLALAPVTNTPSEADVAKVVSIVDLLLARGAEVNARNGRARSIQRNARGALLAAQP